MSFILAGSIKGEAAWAGCWLPMGKGLIKNCWLSEWILLCASAVRALTGL